jgi:5-methylcytosine-specific restriction endonuclease McrA
MTWYAKRFEHNALRTQVKCRYCYRDMWLPPSKVGKYTTCGRSCSKALSMQLLLSRTKTCATCGTSFVPRTTIPGLFCSRRCNTSHLILNQPDVQTRAVASRNARIRSGLIVYPSGPEHHSWKGGLEAQMQRLRDSGVLAERVREYRARNPHKVKEFSSRRRGRKLGRLPRGTVERIGVLQRWKCAICHVDVSLSYHLDHITPLAKGGSHSPDNLQLLCATCNVRKSAKDPIAYMQELGFLL